MRKMLDGLVLRCTRSTPSLGISPQGVRDFSLGLGDPHPPLSALARGALLERGSNRLGFVSQVLGDGCSLRSEHGCFCRQLAMLGLDGVGETRRCRIRRRRRVCAPTRQLGVALVRELLPLIGRGVALIGQALALIGFGLAFIGGALPVVGDAITFACGSLPLVGCAIPSIDLETGKGTNERCQEAIKVLPHRLDPLPSPSCT